MASYDKRHRGAGFLVARLEVAQQSWASGETTAATSTLANVNGLVEQIEVVVGATTNNITFTVAITTANSGSVYSQAAIADDGTSIYKATSDSTNFDAFLACGTLTFTITPSGDPGASGATIDVLIYVR
jgi:hypothetical protein